jgi:hypothetical protein
MYSLMFVKDSNKVFLMKQGHQHDYFFPKPLNKTIFRAFARITEDHLRNPTHCEKSKNRNQARIVDPFLKTKKGSLVVG